MKARAQHTYRHSVKASGNNCEHQTCGGGVGQQPGGGGDRLRRELMIDDEGMLMND